MRDREPHGLVAKQVRDAWRQGGHASSIFGRAVQEMFRIKPIEGVYVCEYSSADFEHARCTGQLLGSWFYAGDQFEEKEPPEKIEQPSAIWSPTPVVSFHFRTSERDFVISWYSGPRAAHGSAYRIIEDNGYRTLKAYGIAWRS